MNQPVVETVYRDDKWVMKYLEDVLWLVLAKKLDRK